MASVRNQVFLSLLSVSLFLILTVNALPKLRTRVLNDPRIPITSFSCDGRSPGYYADVETGCQVYHMCDDGARQYSYICPNTTLFHQRMLICAHWYQVNCSHSEHDYDANLLIGQRNKPFVDEDFWQHRFGGAGNTNFPPQQFPIREVQGNVLQESIFNSGKYTAGTPASSFDFKVSPTPRQVELLTPTQFGQSLTAQFGQQSQTVRSFAPTQESVRSPLPTQQLPVAIAPPPTGFGELFDRNPVVSFQSTGSAQQENAFIANGKARPSLDLEAPYFDAVQQQKPMNFFAVRIKTPDLDELSGIHDDDDNSSSQSTQETPQYRPSIELEPPVQSEAIPTAGQNNFNAFPPSKREDSKEPTITFKKDLDTGALQANATLDDRYTQVYILPAGKQPPRGPYVHPDLTQNKVIFTDWNSLLQEKPDDSIKINNYNEYVDGKIPGDEEKPKKEEDDKNPSDDLQREFSSNFPKPTNFFAVRIKTSDSDELRGIHDEEGGSPSTPNPVQGTQHKLQPALDLLPPYEILDQPTASNTRNLPLGPTSPDMTQVSFGNMPSFASEFIASPALNINNVQMVERSSLESSDFNTRPSLNVNNIQLSGQSNLDLDEDSKSTTVIQNPFQHPFYKIRKMNDDQNIIFIPLSDSDFALELRKVPLNRSRTARRVIVRTRPLSGDVKADEGKLNKGGDSDAPHESKSFKCGHCHQGFLVDKEGCVPCIPLS